MKKIDLAAARAELFGDYKTKKELYDAKDQKNMKDLRDKVHQILNSKDEEDEEDPENQEDVDISSVRSRRELTEHLVDFAQFIRDDATNLVLHDDSFANVLLGAAKKYFTDRPLL